MNESTPEPLVAADGYRLAHRVWGGGEPRATLVLLSGIMSHSAWFRPVALPLAARGVRVVGLDRRGSGENEEARGNAPSPEVLLSDVRLFVERAAADGPVFLLGWCWGAVLGIATALELGEELAGLIVAAPGVFPSARVRERIREESARIDGRALDEVCVRNPVTEEMFTDGPGLELILGDDKRLREFTPRFFRVSGKLGAIAATRIARLQVPLLVLLAENDEAVDNERTREAFGALPDAQVRLASRPAVAWPNRRPNASGTSLGRWHASQPICPWAPSSAKPVQRPWSKPPAGSSEKLAVL